MQYIYIFQNKKKPQEAYRASRKQKKKRILKVNYSAVTAERGATMQAQLCEMKQKLKEESTAQTMIQAKLQVESATHAEMEALHKAKELMQTFCL
jgi:hypothetical protein